MIAPVDIDPKITVRVRINAWQESEVRNLIEHRMIVSTAVAASLWGEISSSAKRKPADLERGEEKQDRTITLPWGIAEQLRRALYGAMLSASPPIRQRRDTPMVSNRLQIASM
jgi:hypothetical protein